MNSRIALWMPAVTAGLLGVALLVWLFVDPAPANVQVAPQSASSIRASLAVIDAPDYSLPQSVAAMGASPTIFSSAMSQYQRKDYSGASVSLSRATSVDPNNPEVRFFLGICYLLTNDTSAGISELRVAQRLGESPYLEKVHFYLAKALLRQNDLVSARQELDAVVAGGGSLAEAAGRLKIQMANAYQ